MAEDLNILNLPTEETAVATKQTLDTTNSTLSTKLDNVVTALGQLTSGVQSVNGKTGVVVLNKGDIELGNVDNTSDLNKPISTATQTALNSKVDKVSTINRVYGTDENGNQTTYDKESFGQVDDVKVDNVSVVTNKVANIDLTGKENISNKVVSVSASSSDVQYPSAKILYTKYNENKERIDILESRGRFLSNWNCDTGLPATNPPTLPYTYKAGDYFIIGVFNSGVTHYKPHGDTYDGTASTTIEEESLSVGDVYAYDGTQWIIQKNTQRTITIGNVVGLQSALDNKVNLINTQGNENSVYFIDGGLQTVSYPVSASADSNTIVSRSNVGNSGFNAISVNGAVGGGINFITTSGETTVDDWFVKADVDAIHNASDDMLRDTKNTIVKRDNDGTIHCNYLKSHAAQLSGYWLQPAANQKLNWNGRPLATEGYVYDNAVSKFATQQDFVVYGQNQDSIFAVKYDATNVADALVQRNANSQIAVSAVNISPTVDTGGEAKWLENRGSKLYWDLNELAYKSDIQSISVVAQDTDKLGSITVGGVSYANVPYTTGYRHDALIIGSGTSGGSGGGLGFGTNIVVPNSNTAIGHNAKSMGYNSVALGNNAEVVDFTNQSVAIGASSKVINTSGIAIGGGIKTPNIANSVVIGGYDYKHYFDNLENIYFTNKGSNISDSDIATTYTNAHTLKEIVEDIALSYDSTSTYNVGDMVLNPYGILVKCNTAITTAEAYDSTKWTETKVMSEIPSVSVTAQDTDKIGSISVNGVSYSNIPFKEGHNNGIGIGNVGSLGSFQCIAIGNSASAVGQNSSIAIGGYNCSANSIRSIAIGAASNCSGADSVSLGSFSKNYIATSISFDDDGSFLRTLQMYDLSKLFFRNENIASNKTTLASYTNGYTLNQRLNGLYALNESFTDNAYTWSFNKIWENNALSSNLTITLEQAPSNSHPTYSASLNITSAITLTFDSANTYILKSNDDNITLATNVLSLPICNCEISIKQLSNNTYSIAVFNWSAE